MIKKLKQPKLTLSKRSVKLTEVKINSNGKVNPFLQYRGSLKGKIDLTSDEFLKIRKSEARLI